MAGNECPDVSNAEPTQGCCDDAKPWSTERILLAAGVALEDNKGPIKLGALYTELVERGVVIGGKIPVNNLGAKLSADGRFETIPHHGWWFRGEPIPKEKTPENEKVHEAYEEEPPHVNGFAQDCQNAGT